MKDCKMVKNNLILIKQALIQIFNKTQVRPVNFDSLKNIDEPLMIFIPFIQGLYYESSNWESSLEYLRSFICTIRMRFDINHECVNSSDKSFESELIRLLCIYDKSNCKMERQDILFLHRIISDFKHIEYIDWEENETFEDIIRYAVSKTILLIYSRSKEDRVEDIPRRVETRVSVVKSCGHNDIINLSSNLNALVASAEIKRAEYLKRRIEPTLELDEYANMVMAAMKQREIEKIKNQNDIFDESEVQNEDEKRQVKIKKDNKIEEYSNFTGQAKNQG